MFIAGPRGVRRRPPVRVLLAPIAVALLLHAALLTGADPTLGVADEPAASVTWMQARSIEPAMAVVAQPVEPQVQLAGVPVPLARPARALAAPASKALRSTLISSVATAPGKTSEAAGIEVHTAGTPNQDPEMVNTVAAATASADAPLAVASDGAGGPADSPPPTYRTVLPPAATLRYDLRSGMLAGSGELVWKPAGGQYEVRLEGSVAGLHVLTETSTGSIDAHGIAPLRYTDWRVRRPLSAANFQRDKGKISYSGPQIEYPLLAGSQDRVSWMIQMAAVLNAEPALAAPGGRIAFFVSGARGDADTWIFRYVALETIAANGGTVRAVKFTREPRKAYDRMVEVWLAPAHHHLPVRAKLTATANGEVFELLLRGIQSP